MKIATSINKKLSLAILSAFFAMACNSAPPPQTASELQPIKSAPTTSTVRRANVAKEPGAVLRERTIRSISEIEIPQTDGKKFKFADLRGKVIVVDIWGTWCPPCREQAPKLAELNNKYRDRGLAVVGLSLNEQEDKAEVLDFIKQAGINYTIAYANEALSGAFLDGTEDGPEGAPIPQLFVISRDGRLVEHLIGNDPRHSLAQLEEIIAKQLNG